VKNHGSDKLLMCSSAVTPGTFGRGNNRRNKRSRYFVLKKVYAINDYSCCGFTFISRIVCIAVLVSTVIQNSSLLY